jgi:protein-L-isoaspartate(D-aspartate) O-methyltransferase
LRRALEEIPRERFLGPGPWTIAGPTVTKTPDDNPEHIYRDVSVALDAGRQLYNGAPGVVTAWIEALDLREGDRVFHVGGATGYYTALLAHIAGPRGRVLMAEVDAALGERAREALADQENVEVAIGDGAAIDPGACDAILIHAGITHPAPLWLERLKDGGRLLAPLTFGFPNVNLGKGALLRITRQGASFAARFVESAAPVVVYSCASARDESLSEGLMQAFTTRLAMMSAVRSVRQDQHSATDTCWFHSERLCLSTCPPGA